VRTRIIKMVDDDGHVGSLLFAVGDAVRLRLPLDFYLYASRLLIRGGIYSERGQIVGTRRARRLNVPEPSITTTPSGWRTRKRTSKCGQCCGSLMTTLTFVLRSQKTNESSCTMIRSMRGWINNKIQIIIKLVVMLGRLRWGM
jgi:hypothetical protein